MNADVVVHAPRYCAPVERQEALHVDSIRARHVEAREDVSESRLMPQQVIRRNGICYVVGMRGGQRMNQRCEE